MKQPMKSALVRFLGWPIPLFHGDTAVLDRWLWLRKRLPRGNGSQRLIDIGCGTGAFTIGTALRGYQALGLSWDTGNQRAAMERAQMCKARTVKFEDQDVRHLDKRPDLFGQFDVAILCEVIEHIIDDTKLLQDAARCLKPNGRLLLTTPNFHLKPIAADHVGPFPTVEDGGHVRKGYTEATLRSLCEQADLAVDAVSYCTGFISQKLTLIHYKAAIHKVHLLGWAIINPFRILPPLLDPMVAQWTHWPDYSICLEAHKPG